MDIKKHLLVTLPPEKSLRFHRNRKKTQEVRSLRQLLSTLTDIPTERIQSVIRQNLGSQDCEVFSWLSRNYPEAYFLVRDLDHVEHMSPAEVRMHLINNLRRLLLFARKGPVSIVDYPLQVEREPINL